jgi:hypothetical protein
MSSDSLRRSGPVTIGPLTLTVEELSIEGELGLLNHLRKRAKEAMGPGSFYANSLPVAEWLRANGKGAEAAALLADTGRLVATGAAPDDAAVWAYQESPDGVADELFWRSRKTHPEARREEIRAVVNDANAVEVRVQMAEALGAKKVPTPSA